MTAFRAGAPADGGFKDAPSSTHLGRAKRRVNTRPPPDVAVPAAASLALLPTQISARSTTVDYTSLRSLSRIRQKMRHEEEKKKHISRIFFSLGGGVYFTKS